MSRRTIMMVEDDATIAGAIAARGRSEGFRVEAATAPDGFDGIDVLVRLCG